MKYIKLFEEYGRTPYQFAYTCVTPSSDEELEAIIDHLYDDTEVDVHKFLSVIPFEEIEQYLPTTYDNVEQLISDYHVKYYIGEFYFDSDEEFNRELCEEDGEEYHDYEHGELIDFAVVVHSAIEHVWKR